jgi:hypothetical protein
MRRTCASPGQNIPGAFAATAHCGGAEPRNRRHRCPTARSTLRLRGRTDENLCPSTKVTGARQRPLRLSGRTVSERYALIASYDRAVKLPGIWRGHRKSLTCGGAFGRLPSAAIETTCAAMRAATTLVFTGYSSADESAEHIPLPAAASISLITAAPAFRWFDIVAAGPRFCACFQARKGPHWCRR